jgi:hypothetical protein
MAPDQQSEFDATALPSMPGEFAQIPLLAKRMGSGPLQCLGAQEKNALCFSLRQASNDSGDPAGDAFGLGFVSAARWSSSGTLLGWWG